MGPSLQQTLCIQATISQLNYFEAMGVCAGKCQPGNNDVLLPGPTGAQWGSKKLCKPSEENRSLYNSLGERKKKKHFCYFFSVSLHLSSWWEKEETPNHHVVSPQSQVRLTTEGGKKKRGEEEKTREKDGVSLASQHSIQLLTQHF